MQKKSVAELISLVEGNNLSTIYSKQDVINLLNNIKTDQIKLDYVGIARRLKAKAYDLIGDIYQPDLVDTSTAEFELNGNEICLTEVEVDIRKISEEFEQIEDESIYFIVTGEDMPDEEEDSDENVEPVKPL
jgi:hypothetical protein